MFFKLISLQKTKNKKTKQKTIQKHRTNSGIGPTMLHRGSNYAYFGGYHYAKQYFARRQVSVGVSLLSLNVCV